MNILIFEQRYTNIKEAGIGRFDSFAHHWALEGHKITILSGMVNYISGRKPKGYRGKLFIKEKESENITVFKIFDSFVGYRTFIGRMLSYFSFCFLALLLSLFLKKPTLIIASSPPIFIGLLGYISAFLKGTPFIFEIRDMWPDEAIDLGFLKNKILIRASYGLEKFLYRKTAFIITNSPGIKDFLVNEKTVQSSKIGIVPNPINFDLFGKVMEPAIFRKEMGWDKYTVILYSGAMSSVYDFDLVLKTAGKFSDLPILFVFVGDGRQKSSLAAKIKELSLKNIILLDAVPKQKVPELISAADICIATLKPLRLLKYVYATKLFDYMAGGKPIVLAMEGVSNKLVCSDSRAGICVAPNDEVAFREAILRLHKNKKERDIFGQAGLSYVLKNHRADKLSEDYLNFIQTSNRAKLTELSNSKF